MTTLSLYDIFLNPSSEYRGKPFWAWNGTLEPEELKRQIRIMKAMGLGGFFMHSRVGLNTPYLSEEWFRCTQACIEEARKQGMEAWLYDEDRWPSGAAGGLVTQDERYRMRFLVFYQVSSLTEIKNEGIRLGVWLGTFKDGKCVNVEKIENVAAIKEEQKLLVFQEEIDSPSDWYNGQTYLDVLNPEAVKKFIEVTHQAYYRHHQHDFTRWIPGIFTDEPNWGHVRRGDICLPWTHLFPQLFQERYGYDLLPLLPHLIYNLTEQSTQIRWHFFDCATYLFTNSFARLIGEWCEQHGILFTGHVLAEETLGSQTSVVGSAMRFYEYMQAPGMDLLTEYRREYHTAKQVSSVARQFNRRWRLTETYGCTGWQFPLSGHKALGDWQLAMGINLRCQHLTWYTMEGEAKRDYPAGIFYHSPWWRFYQTVEDYFARCHVLLSRGTEVRDILMIHPIESMWLLWNLEKNHQDKMLLERNFADIRDALLTVQLDFDYGDEDILSRHGRVEKSTFYVAQAPYRVVVIPPMLTIRRTTLKLLQQFAKSGGKVVFIRPLPIYLDGLPDVHHEITLFAKQTEILDEINPQKIAETLADYRRVAIQTPSGEMIEEVLYHLRKDGEYEYLFVVNTGEKIFRYHSDPMYHSKVVNRRSEYNEVYIWAFENQSLAPVEVDPLTGEVWQCECIQDNGKWKIKTSFPKLGSRLFVVHPDFTGVAKKPAKKKIKRQKSISNLKWMYSLDEPNVLVLDRPQYKIGEGPWQGPEEILRVDDSVREKLGVPKRGGGMIQPWARKKLEHVPETQVQLRYPFMVENIPSTGELFLAIEQPQTFQIFINDIPVPIDLECGWWVDRSLKRIPLDPNWLRKGENTLLLKCPHYSQYHPGLEIVYLLGYFGVKVDYTKVTLTALPETLTLGDITQQGLPFYSGNISYHTYLFPKLENQERLYLKVEKYKGTGIRVLVDGKEVGVRMWDPYLFDLTDFIQPNTKSLVTVEVLGHRRNSHGPHHLNLTDPHWTGPWEYRRRDHWRDDYYLEPTGLMAPPRLILGTESFE